MQSVNLIRWLVLVGIATTWQAHASAQFEISRRLSAEIEANDELLAHARSTPRRKIQGTPIAVSRNWVRAWNENDRSTLRQLTASEVILGWAIDGLVAAPKRLPEIRASQPYKQKMGFAGPTVIAQLRQIFDPAKHGAVIAGATKSISQDSRITDLHLESDPETPFAILVVQRMDDQWLVSDLRVPCEHLSLVHLTQYAIIESLPHCPKIATWMPGRTAQSEEIVKMKRLRNTRTMESFNQQWNGLAGQTKTWPWAQFLRLAMLQENEPTRVTQTMIDQFAQAGGNPHSVAWLKARQR